MNRQHARSRLGIHTLSRGELFPLRSWRMLHDGATFASPADTLSSIDRRSRPRTRSHPMSVVPRDESRAATRAAGWSLIAAAIGFMAVFSFLAARFNYPDVLDGTAAAVLP